jgi:hypothetical protein
MINRLTNLDAQPKGHIHKYRDRIHYHNQWIQDCVNIEDFPVSWKHYKASRVNAYEKFLNVSRKE